MCGIDDLSLILPEKQNEFQGVVKRNSTTRLAPKEKRTSRKKFTQQVYMVSQ